jgi:flagellar basal body P-ring formation protein FlgA
MIMYGPVYAAAVLAGFGLAAAAFPAGATDAQASADPLHVRLKSLVLVRERQIALRDVADVSGGDAQAAARLGSIHLGRAPRLGYTEELSLEEIRRLVRARSVESGDPIVWEGGRTVRIETAAVRYDARRIVELATDHVRRALPKDRYERVEIQPGDAAPDVFLPAGEVSLKVRDIAASKLARSRVAVWVDVSLDGEFYRSVIIPLRLELFGPALVARKSLPRGHLAMPEEFDFRQLDLALLPAAAVSPESALHRRLSRALAAGDALLETSLEEQLAVGAGDAVTLQLHNGAVQIESQAQALSAGAIGQIVKVRPGASDAEILAEVLAPGVVKLSSRQR